MRKSEYIQKLNYRDERFCYIMKNCHHMSREQALEILSKNRLLSYEKQGLVRRLHFIYHSRQKSAIELTDKGRSWIRKNLPQLGSNFYVSGTAVRHNIRLAEQVMAHSLEHGRTWLNERDLRQELMQRIERMEGEERFTLLRQLERGELSVPDGGYYEDGQLYTVEIYNDNYTAEVLAAKDLCAQTLGASLCLVRQ